MLFYKVDYRLGGLVVLEAIESRIIGKFTAVNRWRVIFQYGNLKDINFKLFEKQSKDDCFFLYDHNIFNNLNEVCERIKSEADIFVTKARELKADTQELLEDEIKETERIKEESKETIKRLDKQIRDFSGLDIEREFEKRGLIV